MNIEIIWQEYRALLKGYLASKVANPDDAEDLLQNILIKVHKNLPNLTDNAKIKPWLMQITKNTIIDFYRWQGKTRELTVEDLWYEDADITENELSACIQPFINCLPDKYKDVLTEVDIQGRTQKDFANDHNLAYSTLKSRVQTGRNKLKSLFEQCCEFELDGRGNAIGCSDVKSECAKC